MGDKSRNAEQIRQYEILNSITHCVIWMWLSRHLPAVNRRAAARHGDDEHVSMTRNHQGTYRLLTGEQQRGMEMMSMGRRLETIKSLTFYQQESSSET